jgi:hypothetical protein
MIKRHRFEQFGYNLLRLTNLLTCLLVEKTNKSAVPLLGQAIADEVWMEQTNTLSWVKSMAGRSAAKPHPCQ